MSFDPHEQENPTQPNGESNTEGTTIRPLSTGSEGPGTPPPPKKRINLKKVTPFHAISHLSQTFFYRVLVLCVSRRGGSQGAPTHIKVLAH